MSERAVQSNSSRNERRHKLSRRQRLSAIGAGLLAVGVPASAPYLNTAPPAEVSIPAQPQAPTPGYAGRAEVVISQQNSEKPDGQYPTEYGIPGPVDAPSGDQLTVSEPASSAQSNPESVPGSATEGTSEGVSDPRNTGFEDDFNVPIPPTHGEGARSDSDTPEAREKSASDKPNHLILGSSYDGTSEDAGDPRDTGSNVGSYIPIHPTH